MRGWRRHERRAPAAAAACCRRRRSLAPVCAAERCAPPAPRGTSCACRQTPIAAARGTVQNRRETNGRGCAAVPYYASPSAGQKSAGQAGQQRAAAPWPATTDCHTKAEHVLQGQNPCSSSHHAQHSNTESRGAALLSGSGGGGQHLEAPALLAESNHLAIGLHLQALRLEVLGAHLWRSGAVKDGWSEKCGEGARAHGWRAACTPPSRLAPSRCGLLVQVR